MMRRWILALVVLLVATSAQADILYLRSEAGDIDATGTDHSFSASRGASATFNGVTDTIEYNWNSDSMAGTTLDGDWGCIINMYSAGGGGAGSKVTVRLSRISSAGTILETIFTEQMTVLKGDTSDLTCVGVATTSIVFGAGQGLMFTIYRSASSRTTRINYDGADTNDSQVSLPGAATPTPTFSPTVTPSPTFSPTISPTTPPAGDTKIMLITQYNEVPK
jgi:hypothetical protein